MGYRYSFAPDKSKESDLYIVYYVENGMILSPTGPKFEGRPCETKEDCMTQFFAHGPPIIQVFETAIALNMVKSVKCQLCQPYWSQFREPYPYIIRKLHVSYHNILKLFLGMSTYESTSYPCTLFDVQWLANL